VSASNLLNSLIALAGGSFAAAVAAFLPPPSSWDATDAAAFAFVCGVAGRLLGAGANWVLGPVRDPASGELVSATTTAAGREPGLRGRRRRAADGGPVRA
jgi:hypothetical protein